MSGRPDRKPRYGRVELRVAELARRKGFVHRDGPNAGKVNSSQLARAIDSVDSSVWPLLRAPDRRSQLSFELMARLCTVLECQPGDLFEYIPPGADAAANPAP